MAYNELFTAPESSAGGERAECIDSDMIYTLEQIKTIRGAVAEGREAMRQTREFDPIVFARAFIAHGGIQIPGAPDDVKKRREIEGWLVQSLEQGAPVNNDRTLLREFNRARAETQWTEAAESESVVGFRLKLPPQAEFSPIGHELTKQDHGLGAMVYRKGEIAVLPPECDGSIFTPIIEHEVEQ